MTKPGYTDAMQSNVNAAFSRRSEVQAPVVAVAKPHEGRKQLPGACLIEISRVVGDPKQPRTDWESPEAVQDMKDLTESIKTRGQLQPIRVRWVEEIGKFQVVVGERRLRAATAAGLTSIACVVIEDRRDEADRTEDQLVENALRTDLTPIENAKAFQRLIQAKGYTQRELAERLRIPQPAVTQAMRLLTLPEAVQEQVDSGAIPAATAYEVAKEPDPVVQAELADRVAAGQLSREGVRKHVAEAAGKAKGQGRGASKVKAKGPKVVPLPTERKHKAANGIKVIGERRKGFGPAEWLEALEDAAAAVRASMVEQGGSEQGQAA